MLRGWSWCFPQWRASKLPHPSSRLNAAQRWRWMFGPHVNRADRPDCLTTPPSSLVCYHNCGKKRKADWFSFFWGETCGFTDALTKARLAEIACFGEQSERSGAGKREDSGTGVEHLYVAAATIGLHTLNVWLSNRYMSKPTHECAELLSVISRTAADLLNTLLIYSAAVLIVLPAPSGCLQVHTRSEESSSNSSKSSYQNSNSSWEEKKINKKKAEINW